ncbi:zinc ribbon domain-containing protein [uncultured Clostridium sp.]|uniref:zinc ribbon domain-containing protein n=1 Tax=uncultured Clostridium sp. TaxID=59620 RepID=UPI0028E5F038|nr:zinc ribbon domain-containing protein [uncultured Clostridium sp.]
MFFFGIMGIEERKKSIKHIQNIICKSCERMSTYELIKVYTVFHFFFIPLAKFNKKYYAISRCCNSIFEVPQEMGKLIESGEEVTIDDSNLKEVYVNSRNGNVCNYCGGVIDKSFEFCPHCGRKID